MSKVKTSQVAVTEYTIPERAILCYLYDFKTRVGRIDCIDFRDLRHRILPTYEAEADGVDSEALVKRILDCVEMH